MVQQEQLQQRAEYLRQQRDKLQALRKEQKGKSVAVEETHSSTPVTAPTPLTQVTFYGAAAKVLNSVLLLPGHHSLHTGI